MSDDEGFGGPAGHGGGGDDELSLPRATVQKLVQDFLPNDVTCAKDTREVLIDCCVEFIRLVSSEANDICEKGSKKTIAPEHVMAALKELGFDNFTEGVKDIIEEHKVQQKDREQKQSKSKSGLSPEELERQQELLFAASRARYEAGN